MATVDQLEIIHPDGSVGFYDLEPAKGTTNIGSDPENDIVIESPEVPSFLAMIDHRVKPYQIMILDQAGHIALDGQPLVFNQGYDLHEWSTVSINGHSLVLTEHDTPGAPAAAATALAVRQTAAPGSAPDNGSAAGALAVATASAVAVRRLTLPPADHLDDYLMAELADRENTIECEQTASYPLTVINGGDIVATFEVALEGIDPAWVMIEPASLNLNEGERASLSIAITPPRTPASRAGTHHFAVVVTSPNHPGRITRLGATLNINPFHEFAISDLSPRQLSTGFRKNHRTAVTALALVNRGNAEALYRIEGEDDQRGCAFEYQQPETGAGRSARQTEVRLPPEATTTLSVFVTPTKRRVVGLRKRSYSFTVTSLPLSGQQTPRSVLGQLQAAPLIGPWALLGIAALLTLLIVWIFHPYIDAFGLTSPGEILGGESVTLGWQTSPFVQLKLLEEKTTADGATAVQEVGAVTAPNGTQTFTLYESARYRLVAGNLLSSLLPFLATQSDWVAVNVQPVPPRIELFDPLPVERKTIVLGEAVNLVYRVVGADKVTVVGSDGLVQSLVPTDTGSLSVAPSLRTSYLLGAVNRYGTAEPRQVVIAVVTPTPTPVPKPEVIQFDVQPRVITEGQTVNITWEVVGAEKIQITGIEAENLSPKGKLEQQPAYPGVDYQLTASNGPPGAEQTVIVGPYRVKVNQAPPPPAVPQIVVFQAFPETGIVRGNPATLQWTVTGTTTEISLAGPGLPDTGLKVAAAGQQQVFPTLTGVYILTAINQTVSAVKSATVKVSEPIPPPEVTLRASSTDITEGQPVNLSWEVIGDTVVSRQLTGNGIINPSVDPTGAVTVLPTTENGQVTFRTYELTVRYRDSNQVIQQVVRNVVVSVTPLPAPVIEYFRAGCLSSAGAVVTNTECGLLSVGSTNPTTTDYRIYVGRQAYLYWRTLNATSVVTVTRFAGSSMVCANRDGLESPDPLNACPTDAIDQQEVQYTLTARNAAGAQTTRSIIFRPEVIPAEPPYNLNLAIIGGTVAGQNLTLRLTWNYQQAALGSIVGFRLIRTSHGQEQPGIDLRLAQLPNLCVTNPNNPSEVTCTRDVALTSPDTCSQTFKVAALYRALGGAEVPSDYTYEVVIDSCPVSGQ
jgi:hypothetical protein